MLLQNQASSHPANTQTSGGVKQSVQNPNAYEVLVYSADSNARQYGECNQLMASYYLLSLTLEGRRATSFPLGAQLRAFRTSGKGGMAKAKV